MFVRGSAREKGCWGSPDPVAMEFVAPSEDLLLIPKRPCHRRDGEITLVVDLCSDGVCKAAFDAPNVRELLKGVARLLEKGLRVLRAKSAKVGVAQWVGGGVKQDIEASDQDHVAKEFVVAVLQGMELCGCGLVDGLCGSIGVSALCVCDGAQPEQGRLPRIKRMKRRSERQILRSAFSWAERVLWGKQERLWRTWRKRRRKGSCFWRRLCTFKPKEPAFCVAVFGGVCVGEVVLEARQGLVFALGGDEGEKVWGNLGGSVIELDLAVTWIFFGIDTREKGDVHKQQKRDQGQKESDGFDVAHLGPPAGVCGRRGTA